MRSFNRARLADIVEKNLNPKEKFIVGKDGRLTPSTKNKSIINVEKAEVKEQQKENFVPAVQADEVSHEIFVTKPEDTFEEVSNSDEVAEQQPSGIDHSLEDDQVKKIEKKSFKKKVASKNQSS
jgi:hypothetical protein